MGQPLGIPALMVTVVVIGMGTDYALYLIRACQRYGDDHDSSLGLIRLSVFLSFATTLLGFGVLAACDNPMLKSAGLGLALGIGYSFIGAVTIVPPVLSKMFAPARLLQNSSGRLTAAFSARFSAVTGIWRHTRGSLPASRYCCDPMFPKLADFLMRRALSLISAQATACRQPGCLSCFQKQAYSALSRMRQSANCRARYRQKGPRCRQAVPLICLTCRSLPMRAHA